MGCNEAKPGAIQPSERDELHNSPDKSAESEGGIDSTAAGR